MKDRILLQSELAAYLDRQLERYSVIAPVDQGQFSLYQPIQRGDETCLKYLKPAKSAKEIFFPQNETLFYYVEKSQKFVEPLPPKKETLLFGVNPCDLKGVEAQDQLFMSGPYQDSYYQKKRAQTLIIGLGCVEPEESCFCHYFDLDRFSSPLADLMFTPVGDYFYISVNTERGAQLVEGLEEATPEQKDAFEGLKEEAKKFSTEKIPLENIRSLVEENFDDPLWEEISLRCIGCASCTFVCPTCHCFDITDESKRGIGQRVRTWDTCAFPKFTLHASGHNPRTVGTQRMRQRILHKFSFFPDNQGMISCTGCGRCIQACPVNMDIREVLAELAALT